MDNITGEGANRVAIGVQEGCVVVGFQSPTKWLAMPPDQAIQLATSLMQHALRARGNSVVDVRIEAQRASKQ